MPARFPSIRARYRGGRPGESPPAIDRAGAGRDRTPAGRSSGSRASGGAGSTALPPRTVARAPGVWLRCLPAIPANGRYFGAKLMGMAPSSTTPGVDYVIVLFDRETSGIAAFVDANLVTGYRTASTTAAALDRLVPREPVTLAILGSGLEATMHLRAFASIREIGACTVFSPTPHKRDAFAQSLGAELGIDIRAVATPAEAAIWIGSTEQTVSCVRTRMGRNLARLRTSSALSRRRADILQRYPGMALGGGSL